MRMSKRQINPVGNGEEKRQSYQFHIQRYNRAVRDGFYLEAILIDYACLEDRLRYMLYYLGIIRSESDWKIEEANGRRIQEFRTILHQYTDPKANMTITSISGKSRIVQSVFRMIRQDNSASEEKTVRSLLLRKLDDPNRAEEILSLLEKISDWCAYRNEIVHSLMNKNLDSLNAQVKDKAEEGYALFRLLDNHVQWVKRKKIRSALGL